MKIKNYYLCAFIVWVILTLINCILCVVNIIDGKTWQPILNLCVTVGFAFVSGILFERAMVIKKHNEACDWLHEVYEELKEKKQQELEDEKPFEEFIND